jgi:hypothetical protein
MEDRSQCHAAVGRQALRDSRWAGLWHSGFGDRKLRWAETSRQRQEAFVARCDPELRRFLLRRRHCRHSHDDQGFGRIVTSAQGILRERGKFFRRSG